MTERLLHPITEAAEIIGFGRTKLYELVSAGKIESVTVGRRRLVPHAALEEYVEQLRAEQRPADAA